MKLEPSTVTLRPLLAADIEMLRKWRNSEPIRNSFVYNSEITAEQQALWFEKYEKDDTDRMFIALYEDIPVGASALYNIDKQKGQAEFGRLMLGDLSKRGLGLGKQITSLTTNLGFQEMKLNRIYLEVFEENPYALKIYEDLGYKITGHSIKNDKKIINMEIMAENFKQ